MLHLIIPVYNGEAYIHDMVSQLTAQTDKTFEVIFVNDGSTDNTLNLLNKAKSIVDFRLTVLNQPNQGASAARNLGILQVSSGYINFLDVDDLIPAFFVQVVNGWIDGHSFDLLSYQLKRVNNRDTKFEVNGSECEKTDNASLLTLFLHNPKAFGPVNMVLSSKFVHRKNLRFAVGYKYYEDYDFIVRAISEAGSLRYCKRILYYYYNAPGSSMNSISALRFTCLKLMASLQHYVSSHKYSCSKSYEKWLVSRIYWSVLWQVALACPDFGSFNKVSTTTYAREMLTKLRDFPNRTVRLSSLLFLISPRLYYFAAKSQISKTRLTTLSASEIATLTNSIVGETYT